MARFQKSAPKVSQDNKPILPDSRVYNVDPSDPTAVSLRNRSDYFENVSGVGKPVSQNTRERKGR